MKLSNFILLLSITPIVVMYPLHARAAFEESMLKQLGISASTLDKLDKNKAPAGKYLVDVYLNGNRVSSDWIVVGEDGEIKKDAQFISLVFPEIDPLQLSQDDLSAMKLELNRTTSSLRVQIPDALFKKHYEEYPSKSLGALLNYTLSASRSSIKRHYSQYPTSGIASLLNYNLSTSNTQISTSSSVSGVKKKTLSSIFGKFEANVLLNGWSLKNRFFYTKQNQESNFYRESSFIERKFESGEQIQAGEIVTQNSLFPGLSLIGAQYAPEKTFTQLGTTQAIKGFADTPAQVEVVQNGNIIYSTRVPIGEFTLSNVPINTTSQNVMIRIIGDDGRVVTYPYVIGNTISTSSNSWYSIALGQFRKINSNSKGHHENNNDSKNKFAITGTYNLNLSLRQNISIAALITEAYQNVGTAYSINLLDKVISGTYQVFFSRYGKTKQIGTKLSASTSVNIKKATASLNYSYRSQDHLDPYDIYGISSLIKTDDGKIDTSNKLKQSLSASLSYPLPANISASIGIGMDQYYSGENYKRAYVSLGKQFKYATTSLYLQKSDTENSVFFNVSIPLGKRGTIGTSVSQVGKQQSLTTTYSNSYFNRKANVTLGTNSIKTGAGSNMYAFAQGSYRGSMATYTGGVTYNKQKELQGLSYNAGISGGIAFTKKGIDFSSDRIDDTFAIASVDGEDSVVIDAPGGSVTPTITGRAVIPRVYPYKTNRISVNMAGLPQDVYAIGGEENIKSGFGGISYVNFKFGKNITGLYKLLAKVGEPLIAGAVVATDSGEFVTVVGPEQNLVIDHKTTTKKSSQTVFKYQVSENDVPRCTFELTDKLIKEKSGDIICYPLK
ncbi:fimbria/pilus outer membrane usher protein [Photobacterium damselae]